MSSLWYIDTIDARAGLCFASYRPSDLQSDSLEDVPAIFIGPPFFEPERLASRSTGLGAARGSFQLGLFRQDEYDQFVEIGFLELDDIVDFVRRCYVGGAGGDRGDGGGGPPRFDPENPTRPDGGNEDTGESGKSKGRGPAESITALLTEISTFVGKRPVDFITPRPPDSSPPEHQPDYTWFEGVAATSATRDYSEILSRAGLRIAAELLYRFPLYGSHPANVSWPNSMRSLGLAFSRLNLWHSILSSPDRMQLVPECERILSKTTSSDQNRFLSHYSEIERATAMLLIVTKPFKWGLDHKDPWLQWLYFDYFRTPRLFDTLYSTLVPRLPALRDREVLDPVEQLASWPLPQALHPLFPNIREANVLELMNLFLASPAEVAALKKDRVSCAREASELLIFGAACIVSSSNASTLLDPSIFDLQSSAARTWDWLASQLPRRVLPVFVDDLVATVRDKKYET